MQIIGKVFRWYIKIKKCFKENYFIKINLEQKHKCTQPNLTKHAKNCLYVSVSLITVYHT